MASLFRAFWDRPRLLWAIAVAAGIAALPTGSTWTRLLVAWCVGVILYAALAVHAVARLDGAALRRQASRLDDSAPVISLFAVLAAAASIGAVTGLVFGQAERSLFKAADAGLAGLAIVCAWLFVQLVFAIHYLHVFYGDGEDGERRGGLDFHAEDDPDFWDFVYFSITIGATAQTSDTEVTTKPLRRIVTAHAAYSYFFNTGVLALAVNIASGLVQH